MLDSGFYNMDCMDGMKEFPDKFFDLAIVDPPYGLNIARLNMGAGKSPRCSKIQNRQWEKADWDKAPDDEYFTELSRVSNKRIIWGGNYFNLPPCKCFLIWDKGGGMYGRSFSECEMAWSDLNDKARIFKYNPIYKERFHPTQKPIALYTWILNLYAKPGFKILDTHVGSASSLIACYRAGLEYWGFETHKGYYQKATERLETEKAQMRMTF